MKYRGKTNRRLLAVIAFGMAFAFAASAFVHSPFPTRSSLSQIDLSAYTLPDGTVPSICFGLDEDQGGSSQHCPFCTLCEILVLPARADISLNIQFASIAFNFDYRDDIVVQNSASYFRSRAPPASIGVPLIGLST